MSKIEFYTNLSEVLQHKGAELEIINVNGTFVGAPVGQFKLPIEVFGKIDNPTPDYSAIIREVSA